MLVYAVTIFLSAFLLFEVQPMIANIILPCMAGRLGFLPIIPAASWKPVEAGDPSIRILLLLTATIGLPYVLLSTTSPLLQAWYVAAKPGAVPYRLFALSNMGSLLALLSYPVIVEPMFTTHGQAYGWSGIYLVFFILSPGVAGK